MVTKMADSEAPPKKKKLPPLGKESEENEGQKKPVRKKKKKPTETTTNGEPGTGVTTPKKKKAPATSEDGEKPTPRKRKKRKPPEQTEDGQPTSARSGASQEEVAGSKTSLISKDDNKTTPKKKVKKKIKKASPRVGDEFMDAAFAADLSTIQEDIVTNDKKDEDGIPHPYSTESAVLKSQPLENLFIETNSGFKRENKTKLARRWAEEEKIKQEDIPDTPISSTIEFAIFTHNVYKTFCLFIHGLTAGIAIWHIITVYVLLYHSNIDFLEHYRPLALPVQCMFYILLVLCTVSACDRFDIANPTRRFVLRSLTLQTGTVSIIIYFAALILSLSIANIEDRINLHNRYPDLWMDASTTSSEIDLWRNINTARGVLMILAWIVLSITSTTDRLGQMLKEGDDFIIGDTVELDHPA